MVENALDEGMRQEHRWRRYGQRPERRRSRDRLGRAPSARGEPEGQERLCAVVGVLHGSRHAAALEHAHQCQLLLGLQGERKKCSIHYPRGPDDG